MHTRILLLLPLLTLACHREPASTPATVLPAVTLTQLVPKAPETGANFWIPRAAIVQRGGIAGVFIAQDRQARFRMLRLGRERASQVEVLAVLLGNETLLLGDLAATHDGSPLQDSAHGK